MRALSQQRGLANASRQGPPREAVEMSYKHAGLNKFSNFHIQWEFILMVCEQQVDSALTTTPRYCILFLDSWLLQNWLNCGVFFYIIFLVIECSCCLIGETWICYSYSCN